MQRFIGELEQKYGLTQEASQLKQNDFTLNATCEDLKARIEGIFRLLNRSSGIESEKMYHDILSAFNLETLRSGKGFVVAVTDNEGHIVRCPMRLSDIREKVKIPEDSQKLEKQMVKQVEEQINAGFKELFKKYRFCDLQTASLELRAKGLYLFWNSETSNYKVYSPENKMVFNNSFQMDKQMIRLDYFNLTNQDFYAIIKDYNQVLAEKHRFVSEGLIDYQKIPANDLKNQEIVLPLKALNLSESQEYTRITCGMDDLSKSFTESAIKDYYRYSILRMIETEQRINQYDFYREYNQNRKFSKNGLKNCESIKYNLVKVDDQFYLNNHPAGLQEVSLNMEQLKYHMEGTNFFTKSILEVVRLLPWYSNDYFTNNEKRNPKIKSRYPKRNRFRRNMSN